MVFLAITPTGLANALRAATADDAVWCGSDAISEADFATMEHQNLTRFIYELGDGVLVDDAIGTITEHHPEQIIWVEAAAST